MAHIEAPGQLAPQDINMEGQEDKAGNSKLLADAGSFKFWVSDFECYRPIIQSFNHLMAPPG